MTKSYLFWIGLKLVVDFQQPPNH